MAYIPSEMIYYSVYEYSKRTLKNQYKNLQNIFKNIPDVTSVEPLIYLFCGGISEICSATIWIPCDVIQQKLMIQGPIATKRLYNGGFGIKFIFF